MTEPRDHVSSASFQQPDCAQLFTFQQWNQLRLLLRLTPRQLGVARLLCADCGQKEIARRLRLSPDTVGTHLKALYRRLGVNSRLAVVIRLVLVERTLNRSLAGRAAPGKREARARGARSHEHAN